MNFMNLLYAVNIGESKLLVRCQQIKNGHAHGYSVFDLIEDDGMITVRDRSKLEYWKEKFPGLEILEES